MENQAMRYTPRSDRVLRHAEQIARAHGHDYVGTEHLLLGLLAEPDGIAGQVLARVGVADRAAQLTEEIMASPTYSRH
jgi:ATP-dependent Clp protease ATP-binding subunit ClpC